MLEMPEWVQKSRHFLRLHFPELWCLFASSATFDLSLEDLIQRLRDTSSVLFEGWEGGASGRVKSQLPSLGLGHIWGTTYVPSSLWKQAVAYLYTTCMISDSDRFILFHVLLPLSPYWFLYENILKYKFNIQDSIAFLYTSNNLTKNNSLIPFMVTSKTIKYLKIDLTKV